ncbi:MAG: LPS export ABC transporter permease LptF [Tahibacter sp.]
MLRILDRYLLRELAFGFFASAGVLLIVTLGGTFADILAKVARGRMPANLMFELLGLRTLGALTVLLPLALFLGVLLAYGRLWRDSEMAVLQGSGVSLVGLARPLAMLAVPAVLALALISFWLAPAGVRLSQTLLEQASRSMVVAGMEPGRFIELPGRAGAIFVGSMNNDGSRFERMFVESERADGEDVRIDVITAESGELGHDSDGNGRFLALKNGFRVEGRIGHDDYRLLRFKGNDIALADNDSDTSPDSVKEAAPSSVLLASDDPLQRAELHWRLAAPVSALVLMLLALPLSRATPRESRYGKLLVAVLCYLIYASFLGVARNWLGQDRFVPALGLWWVHVPTLAIALLLLRQSGRLPRQRNAR